MEDKHQRICIELHNRGKLEEIDAKGVRLLESAAAKMPAHNKAKRIKCFLPSNFGINNSGSSNLGSPRLSGTINE